MGKTLAMDEPPPLDPARHGLFLDYDGTLVAIAPTPDEALADKGLRELLARMEQRLGGALAIVTGRPVADIDRFLAPLRLTVAGLHGLDLRPSGQPPGHLPPPSPVLAPARRAFADFSNRFAGTLVEDKRLSVALHYRQLPSAAEHALALASRLVTESSGDLRLQPGKMVVELLPAGADKGTAIETLAATAPFAGRRPVFVGDDVTDEAGFRAVNALGGLSVHLGAGPSEASHRLPDVAALRRWLARAVAA
ncbi:MAG: trehalose-phosphatase [Geminicoccaceae bacterium]